MTSLFSFTCLKRLRGFPDYLKKGIHLDEQKKYKQDRDINFVHFEKKDMACDITDELCP